MTPGRRSWSRLFLRAEHLAVSKAARSRGWLVIAPHADDETLGAGGLIAALAASRADVAVAYLTDGAGSHVGAPGWSPGRVAGVRAQEARAALRQLGLRSAPVMLGWRDAAPFVAGDAAFEASARRLVAVCRRLRVRNIVASWNADPHCDHDAAAALAGAVARHLKITPRFYGVWAWTLADLEARLRPMRAIALPVARWRGRQRRALACHGTQLGGRIVGAAERFVLPRPMRRLVDATHILLLEPRHAP